MSMINLTLYIGALLLFVFSIYRLIRTYFFTRKSFLETEATVIKVEQNYTPDDSSSRDRITFTYTAAEKEYESKYFCSSYDNTQLGEKIKIFYRENNPNYLMFISPKRVLKNSFIGILISIGMFVLLIIITS